MVNTSMESKSFFATLFDFSFTSGIFFAFIVVPIATLFYLIFARVSLEMVAIFFRIGENTSQIASSLSGSTPPAPPSGWGPPGAYQ